MLTPLPIDNGHAYVKSPIIVELSASCSCPRLNQWPTVAPTPTRLSGVDPRLATTGVKGAFVWSNGMTLARSFTRAAELEEIAI